MTPRLILCVLLLAATVVACPFVPGAARLAGAAQPSAGSEWRRRDDVSPPALRREFRGLWVASVANIDWPSRRGLPVADLRREMMTILGAAKRANFNAIVLQVRPACDALYRSDLEPWSEFLTGASGRPPPAEPEAGPEGSTYDPLVEWIREAHALGLELHAWINPFRARHFESREPEAPAHVSNARPELVRRYGRYLWLDPGEERAREHTLAVALDIVTRYDIDGLHFDDYFYPYPEARQPFPDDEPFARARAANPNLDRDDWRRANIDLFVRTLYERVKRAKPHVKVGISPFGIWRPGSPPGVVGFDAYASLYADARTWLRSGWLDYAAPQLYWPIESKGQPFGRLLDWWIDQNDMNRHIWPGLNASRILAESAKGEGGAPAASWEPGEIVNQVVRIRTAVEPLDRAGSPWGGGSIFFSAVALVQNRRGLADALVTPEGPFAAPALVPASPWLRAPAGNASPTAPAPPALSIVPASGGLEIALPEAPDARWWGIWNKRARGWGFHLFPADQLAAVGVIRGTGPRVLIPPGAGDAELQAVGAFWIDATGAASPTTVLSRER
ncbi:MAG: glycoside hydrolase family 10 protein [Phycisphaerales bacterium]